MALCKHQQYPEECSECLVLAIEERSDAAEALLKAIVLRGHFITTCDGYKAQCRICERAWWPNSEFSSKEVHEDDCALAAYKKSLTLKETRYGPL